MMREPEKTSALMNNLIQSDPSIMMGKPVIVGTRITVELILEKLAAGESIEQMSAASPEPRLEDLAYHFSEGGDWVKALLYAERAGERADALHAPAGAVDVNVMVWLALPTANDCCTCGAAL